jgi:hypothetical protein
MIEAVAPSASASTRSSVVVAKPSKAATRLLDVKLAPARTVVPRAIPANVPSARYPTPIPALETSSPIMSMTVRPTWVSSST